MSKKSYKKYFNATLAATVAATGAAAVVPNQAEASTSFSDVSSSYNFYKEITNLSERGIIKGFEDGTFRPGANVTRGQAAKIIAGALGLDTVNVSNPGLKDIPTTHQYYGAIAALANAGIISGYEDDTFRPGEPVQRNHMAKIIAGAFKLQATAGYTTPLTDVRSDYKNYVTALHEYGVTTGKTATTFDGSSNVTRGQLAAFVVRAENVVAEASDGVTFTISEVAGTTVTGEDATYNVTTALQGVFASSNAKVLNGAVLKAKVVDNEIVSVETLELNAGGEAGALITLSANNAVIDGNLVVNADYIEVKNLTVKGNVTLTDKVVNEFGADGLNSEGEFIIDEDATPVAVASLTTIAADVKKGAKVNFKNSKINKVNSKRNNVALSSDSKIGEVVVSAKVSAIQIDANVTKVTIDVDVNVTVTGNGNIDEVSVQKATEIALQVAGTVAKLLVNDENAKVEVATEVKVTTLVVPNNKEAKDVISNYDSVSKNIGKVEKSNGAAGSTNTGGSKGGGGSNRDKDRGDTVQDTIKVPFEILIVDQDSNTTTVTLKFVEKQDNPPYIYSIRNSSFSEWNLSTEDKKSFSFYSGEGNITDFDYYVKYDGKVYKFSLKTSSAGKTILDKVEESTLAEFISHNLRYGHFGSGSIFINDLTINSKIQAIDEEVEHIRENFFPTLSFEYKVTSKEVNGEEKVEVIVKKDGKTASFLLNNSMFILNQLPAPDVKLDDDTSAVAKIQIKDPATGSYRDAWVSDALEYSLDGGANWTVVNDLTTIDASTNIDIIVRVKASVGNPPSLATGDLDTSDPTRNDGTQTPSTVDTITITSGSTADVSFITTTSLDSITIFVDGTTADVATITTTSGDSVLIVKFEEPIELTTSDTITIKTAVSSTSPGKSFIVEYKNGNWAIREDI